MWLGKPPRLYVVRKNYKRDEPLRIVEKGGGLCRWRLKMIKKVEI